MNRDNKREYDYPVELESQFILRMPEEPAKVLREILQTGGNLKDRITIQMENDMRYGEVRLDHWLMHAKVVDMPTIIESLKTIDNKSFYKTADICQMMICKEEPEQPSIEEESPNKNKKKDPYKVDKKFLFPHGITPPTKNVRKRRFRKTLKKKYVEAPEIEKEVKRLLRVDNDAVSVTWDVITEEEEHASKGDVSSQPVNQKLEKKSKHDVRVVKPENVSSDLHSADTSNVDVEHDIFGGAVSDSDLENDDENINVDLEDTSRLSAYDSRMSDSNSMHAAHLSDSGKAGKLPTQFRPDMFLSPRAKYSMGHDSGNPSVSGGRSATPAGSGSFNKRSGSLSPEDSADYQQGMSKENISLRMEQLNAELEALKQRRQRTQTEISGMENLALRQRFKDILQNLEQDIVYKEMEYQELQTLHAEE